MERNPSKSNSPVISVLSLATFGALIFIAGGIGKFVIDTVKPVELPAQRASNRTLPEVTLGNQAPGTSANAANILEPAPQRRVINTSYDELGALLTNQKEVIFTLPDGTQIIAKAQVIEHDADGDTSALRGEFGGQHPGNFDFNRRARSDGLKVTTGLVTFKDTKSFYRMRIEKSQPVFVESMMSSE